MTKKAAKRPMKKAMEHIDNVLAKGQVESNDDGLLTDMENIVTRIRTKLAFHREQVGRYTGMLTKMGLSPDVPGATGETTVRKTRSRGEDSCKGRVLEAIKLGKTTRKDIGDFVVPFGFTPNTLNVTLYTMAKKGEIKHDKAHHTYTV